MLVLCCCWVCWGGGGGVCGQSGHLSRKHFPASAQNIQGKTPAKRADSILIAKIQKVCHHVTCRISLESASPANS